MRSAIVCWNCRALVSVGLDECPRCYAGLDPSQLGSAAGVIELEENVQVLEAPLRPSERLGCVLTGLLILGGFLLSIVVSFALMVFFISRRCNDGCEDLFMSGLDPVALVPFLWPVLAAGLIVYTSRRRKRSIVDWDATHAGERA